MNAFCSRHAGGGSRPFFSEKGPSEGQPPPAFQIVFSAWPPKDHVRSSIEAKRFTGKTLQLTACILGIHSANSHRTAVMIPEGATVQAASDPSQSDIRLVDVLWEGRTLAVFAEDLVQRSKEVKSVRGSRSASA
jgi:hypothetical protein